MTFNGTSAVVSFGNNYNFERTDKWSVGGVFMLETFNSINSTLIRKSSTASAATGWAVFIESTLQTLHFYLGGTSVGNRLYVGLDATQKIRLGVPYVWGVSYDGSSDAAGVNMFCIPLNGEFTAFGTKETPISNTLTTSIQTAQGLAIGRASSNDRHFDGLLQDVYLCSGDDLTLEEFQDIVYENRMPATVSSRWIGPDAPGLGATITDEVGSIDGTRTNALWSRSSWFTPPVAAQNMSNSLALLSANNRCSWTDDPAFAVSEWTAEIDITFNSLTTSANDFFAKWTQGSLATSSFLILLEASTAPNLRATVVIGGVSISTPTTSESNYRPPLGTKQHVVVTHDGQTLKLYSNGKLLSQVAAVGAMQTSTAPITLGTRQGASFSAIAYVHRARFYGQAATAEQVEQLYYERTTFATPIIEALMTEGAGTSVGSTGSYTASGAMTGTNIGWVTNAPYKSRQNLTVARTPAT